MRWSCTDKGHVPENEAATAKSWIEFAEGDLYGNVEEFSMDGDG